MPLNIEEDDEDEEEGDDDEEEEEDRISMGSDMEDRDKNGEQAVLDPKGFIHHSLIWLGYATAYRTWRVMSEAPTNS